MWYIWLSVAIKSVLALLILAFLTAAIGIYHRIKCKQCDLHSITRRLDGKTVLVTGGTAGMGLEVAKRFARQGARVIIACPFEQEGDNALKQIVNETGNKNVIFALLNLASLSSTREFAEKILTSEERLDILVNNAGVLRPDKMTADGLNFVMQVNYYGMFLLTILLLPLLKKTGSPAEPSRIVNVSSLAHKRGQVPIGNNYRTGIKAYPDSKLCLTIFVQDLAAKLSQAGITNVVVNAADPGIAATGIADGFGKFMVVSRAIMGNFFPSAKQGAQTTIYVSLNEKIANVSGKYFKNCELSEPSAYSVKTANKLWEETVGHVKLSDEKIKKCFENV